MKEKSSEELNEELKEALLTKNIELIPNLVKQVGKDIDKDLIFEAINSNNTGIVNYIASSIVVNKEMLFSELYEIGPNPVEYSTNYYLSLRNQFTDDLPLSQLILDNCNKTLENLSKCGASVNANTVSIAIQSNCDQSITDNLLKFDDIELNKTTGYFLSPLNTCFWSNKSELFEKLIEKGADVNFASSGQDKLIFDCIAQNKQEFLDILIKYKVDLNVVSIYQDKTPIEIAFSNSSFDTAEKLIQNGAKIDLDKMKNDGYLSEKKMEFILKHDSKTQEILQNISSENAYFKFEEAKKENDIFLIKVFLKEHSSSIFSQIAKDGTHKENIYFFQKNNIPIKFQYDHLIVGSQINIINETIGGYNNPEDIKQKSKTFIQDNKIFNEVTKDELSFSENINKIYVMDKKGVLYVQNDSFEGLHHSFFLKGKHEKDGKKNELYGYGKPIACGGHIEIKEGKITYIDNESGHYKPNIDQLKMAVNYLNKQGLVDENVVIMDQAENKKYELKEFLSGGLDIKVPELYKKDKKIENKPSFIKEQSDNEISRNSKEKEGQEVSSKERPKIKQLVEGIDIKRNVIDAPQPKTISSVKPAFIQKIINKGGNSSKDINTLGGR